MDMIGLMNFRGDEVMRRQRVAFRIPKEYTAPQPDAVREETAKPTTSPLDSDLAQETLRIACEKFVVWVSKFSYRCIDRDLEYLEQELKTLGFRIEIGESTFVEEGPLRSVFSADISLFKGNTWVATEKRVVYNAPPHYRPNESSITAAAVPDVFTGEDLGWIANANGYTVRWPLPEDERLIAAAKNLTADR